MSEPGWTWFEAPRAPDDGERLELARAARRVFASPDGERLLAHLKALTVDRCVGPDVSDAGLRTLEGQRQLVLHLMSLAALGRSGA